MDEPDQPADAGAAAALTVGEAQQLEAEDLASLMARYSARKGTGERRPGTRILASQSYDRDPLVIAIARKRAGNECEIADCPHDPFLTKEGVAYVEVHHIHPLSVGGEDTVENVVCLCASHHREVHLGADAAKITSQLKNLRANPPIT